jgi:2-dehydropantoate 2-reductase
MALNKSSEISLYFAGAGTVGCYLGAWLAANGANVKLLLRPWLAKELSAFGIKVSHWRGCGFSNPKGLTWTTHSSSMAQADVIFVTVKSGATEKIAREIACFASKKCLIVSLQNGVENLATLRHFCSDHEVVGGMVPFNIVNRGAGHFHQGTSGELWFGQGGSELVSLLSSYNLTCRYHGNIEAVHWGKLLLNLNNVINALSDLPLQQELSQRRYRLVLAATIREALKVYDGAGIHAKSVIRLPLTWLPALLSLPDSLFNVMAPSILAIDPNARSSMWEDLQKGRKTEFDDINGKIIRLGKKLDIETPVNTHLQTLISDAEKEGLSAMPAMNMLP